jgi:hypothetical protein
VDTLISLLTRLVIVADSKQAGRKSRLMISDTPIAKPVSAKTSTKLKKAS